MFLEPEVLFLKKTSILYKDFLPSSFKLKEPIYLAELKKVKTLNFRAINWDSDRTYLILNPKTSKKEKAFIQRASFPYLKGHIWLRSSGTSSFVSNASKNFSFKSSFFSNPFFKWVALSKKSLLLSARSVNQHIGSQKSDIWLNALPSFHVGGLSIFIRAYLSKAKVIPFHLKFWDAQHFVDLLYKKKVTLTSLVPTQLRDLIHLNLTPPKCLRAIFVGGDAMSPFLYALARKKGWNVLPTYGLTECASQVATAGLESLNSLKDIKTQKNPKDINGLKTKYPPLRILFPNEIQVKNKRILIKSPCLLTGINFLFEKKNFFSFYDKRKWFDTEDVGAFVSYQKVQRGKSQSTRHQTQWNKQNKNFKFLFVQGRKTDEIKVGGERVSLRNLFFIFEELKEKLRTKNFCFGSFQIISTPSTRLGRQVDLIVERKFWKNFLVLLDEYQKQVMPFERIRNVYGVEKIKKGILFKKNKKDLLNQLGFSSD